MSGLSHFGSLCGDFPLVQPPPAITTLAWSGLWLGPYTGSPLVAVASAGASGANGNLTEATHPPATSGPPNDWAAFDGAATRMADSTVMPTFLGAAGASGTLAALIWLDAYGSNGVGYNEPGILADSSGNVGLSVGAAGVAGWIYPDAGGIARKAIGLGSWHLVCMRWAASSRDLLVDSAAAVTTSCGSASVGGATPIVGRNYAAAAFFNGRARMFGLMDHKISDADYAAAKAALNFTYGLAL